MKKMRFLSILLTLVMTLGMFNGIVLADDSPKANVSNVKSAVESFKDPKIDTTTQGGLGATVLSVAKAILGLLTLIAGAIAVGMLIFIGIKYMTKGAGAKAEVKDTLLPYLIGAVLVGGASAIAGAVLSIGQ